MFLTITDARKMLDSKSLSPEELSGTFLKKAKEVQSKFNAYREIFTGKAEEDRSTANSPLCGIPYSVQENICIKNQLCSAGSKILQNYRPLENASVIEYLNQAGAVVVGTTNMDEFCGGCKNPWDSRQSPGGYSGGAAVSVVCGSALFALASDSGGSACQSAAQCNLTILKPTYGTVSRYGLIAFASSTEQIVLIANNAQDCEILLHCLAVQDAKDMTCRCQTAEMAGHNHSIAMLQGPYDKKTEKFMQEIETLLQPCIIKKIKFPEFYQALKYYKIRSDCEAFSNLLRYDGCFFGQRSPQSIDFQGMYENTRRQFLGKEVQKHIQKGKKWLSLDLYEKTERFAETLCRRFSEIFQETDILITPTTPHMPMPGGGEKSFTAAPSLAGLPVMSLPGPFIEHMPFGLQIIADRANDYALLSFAKKYQTICDFHRKRPPEESEP